MIIILLYTILRNYGINFGTFNASFALLLSLYLLRYRQIFDVTIRLFIVLLPSLLLSFLVNGWQVGIYGFYEVLNLVGSIGAAKFVISREVNDFVQIRSALRFITISYLVVALIQFFAPASAEIFLDTVLYPNSGGREWRTRYALANGLRITSNYGASTAAGGHLLLILIVADLYRVKGWFITIFSEILTFSRHSIVLMMFYLSRLLMSWSGFILVGLLLLVGDQFGVFDILLERFSRGVLSDENVRSRLIYGIFRYVETMGESLKNVLFGLGPGLLYSIGDPEWNNSGYVSNGLLLFSLQYGWLSILVGFVAIMKRIDFSNWKLLLILGLLVMADNYSYHSSSFHFLIFLIYYKICRKNLVATY